MKSKTMQSTIFCCEELQSMACEPESPLQYEPEKRRFRIWSPAPAFQKKGRPIFVYDIFFCPKCGKELPEDLAKEWADTIREKFKVYNILDPKGLAKLPPEYLTEEWWKEEGL
jgi:hypothetical protein